MNSKQISVDLTEIKRLKFLQINGRGEYVFQKQHRSSEEKASIKMSVYFRRRRGLRASLRSL